MNATISRGYRPPWRLIAVGLAVSFALFSPLGSPGSATCIAAETTYRAAKVSRPRLPVSRPIAGHEIGWDDLPKLRRSRMRRDEPKSEDARTVEPLEQRLAALFPDSNVKLQRVGAKIIVRGQAASAEEGSRILAFVRAEMTIQRIQQTQAQVVSATDVSPRSTSPEQTTTPLVKNVIDVVDVPKARRIVLTVRVIELRRPGTDQQALLADRRSPALTALRGFPGAFHTVLGPREVAGVFDELTRTCDAKLVLEQQLLSVRQQPVDVVLAPAGNRPLADSRSSDTKPNVRLHLTPQLLYENRLRLTIAGADTDQPGQGDQQPAGSTSQRKSVKSRPRRGTVNIEEGQWLLVSGLWKQPLPKPPIWMPPIEQTARQIGKFWGARMEEPRSRELLLLVRGEQIVDPPRSVLKSAAAKESDGADDAEEIDRRRRQYMLGKHGFSQ